MHELEEAVQRVVAGPRKKSRIISEKEKRVIAFHEAGHALVANRLPNADPVHEVAIISRGGALGYTLQLPTEDRYLITKSEILDRVTSALAGRAAEEMIFDEVSSGAANDLEVATRLVRRMIMEFGMSEKLGPLTFGKKEGQVFLGRDLARERDFSEEVAAAIDQEESDIIKQCYERAKQILAENRETLVLLAETLLEKETLKAEELERLMAGKPLEDAEPEPEKTAKSAEPSKDVVDEGFSKEVQRPGRVTPVPEVQ
jgi:cell division protease FtsH